MKRSYQGRFQFGSLDRDRRRVPGQLRADQSVPEIGRVGKMKVRWHFVVKSIVAYVHAGIDRWCHAPVLRMTENRYVCTAPGMTSSL